MFKWYALINSIHVWKWEIIYENEKKGQLLNFLDGKIILHEDNSVEIEIYYKPTHTHGY